MSERDIGMALATLAEAFGMSLGKLPPVRVKVYIKALEKVPVPLLEPMAMKAISTREFFPKPSDLLKDAETCRKELMAATRFHACEACSQQGWAEREIDGVRRMVRCDCWRAFQAKLEQLGVGHEPLALPAAEERELSRIGED